MAVNLSPVGGVAAQFFTNTGAVLSGGKLYTYAAGTTTPLTTYTTSAGNVARTNPIVLDSAGRVSSGGEIWVTVGVNYKFVLNDSNDVLIGTYDNVPTQANTDASLVTYTPAGTGAVTTTVQAKLRQTVSVKDFGAVGNGVTDDTAAIQAAVNAAQNIDFIGGESYLLTSEITVPSTCKALRFNGAILLVDHAGPDYAGSTATFRANHAITYSDGVFQAQNKDYTEYYGWTSAAGWVKSTSPLVGQTESHTLTAREYLFGLTAAQGSLITNNKFDGFYIAALIERTTGAPQKSDPLTKFIGNDAVNCGAGTAGVQVGYKFDYLSNLVVDGNRSYFGAEHTWASCQNVVISNNVFFNPTTPTIDIGGSPSAGYQSKHITVVGNVSSGRDAIVCELGVEHITITGNVCEITSVVPSGTGIGVTTQSAGGQDVQFVNITGNTIRKYNDDYAQPYAYGILVATQSGSDAILSNVLIADNIIAPNSIEGIRVQGNATIAGFKINVTGNSLNDSYRPIVGINITKAKFSDNDLRAYTYQGTGSAAFVMEDCGETTCAYNIWNGSDLSTYGHINVFRLSGAVGGLKFFGNDIYYPNFSYFAFRAVGTTGDVFFQIQKIADLYTLAGTTDIAQGSQWTFQNINSTGDPIGRVCITPGAAPVMADYGVSY